MGPSAGANREEASPPPPPAGEKHEPKAAGEAKAEQAPQQVADQGPKPVPAGPKPAAKPGPKKRPLAFGEMSEADKVVGQHVTWVARPVSSNSDGGGAQHVFFGKGPEGEFTFGNVFLAAESVPYAESPIRRALDEFRDRYLEGRRQERREKDRLRAEERNRQIEELRKGGREAIRKSVEESRKRLAESRKPETIAERRAKAKGKGPQPPPILVTVTGTITRFDTLLLLGHGKSHDVPVLRNVTITANP
jgi:hypothetical protein